MRGGDDLRIKRRSINPELSSSDESDEPGSGDISAANLKWLSGAFDLDQRDESYLPPQESGIDVSSSLESVDDLDGGVAQRMALAVKMEVDGDESTTTRQALSQGEGQGEVMERMERKKKKRKKHSEASVEKRKKKKKRAK